MGQMTQATPGLKGASAKELLEQVILGVGQGSNPKESSPGDQVVIKQSKHPRLEADKFITEALAGRYDVSGFDCGSEILNNFLKHDALKNQEQALSFTTLYLSPERLPAAFISLAADIIPVELESLREELGTKRSQFPVVKICRLARDKRFYGCGLGERMLRDVTAYARSLSGQAPFGLGCRFVVVNARPETLETLYFPFGFKTLQKSKRRGRVTLIYDLLPASTSCCPPG